MRGASGPHSTAQSAQIRSKPIRLASSGAMARNAGAAVTMYNRRSSSNSTRPKDPKLAAVEKILASKKTPITAPGSGKAA